MSRFYCVSGSLLLLAALASGCVVPESRYEEARSATRVEQEANRRTQARLTEVSRQLDALKGELDQREKKIADLETDISQAKLDADVAHSERQYALELVDQLRSDLARTGDNLRLFAAQKDKLSSALDAAETRAKHLSQCERDADENARVIRDLSLVLHDPIATGEVELDLVEGRALLRFPASDLAGEAPGPVGREVLDAVARVAALHSDARVRLSEAGTRDDPAHAAERLKQVADLLQKRGLAAQRVELRPGSEGQEKSAPAATLEIAVFVDDGSTGAAAPAG